MKGFGFFATVMGLVLSGLEGVSAGVIDTGFVKRDALEAECGKGNFGGIFKSTSPTSLSPSVICFFTLRYCMVERGRVWRRT